MTPIVLVSHVFSSLAGRSSASTLHMMKSSVEPVAFNWRRVTDSTVKVESTPLLVLNGFLHGPPSYVNT
jgi:hypothetical protein